MWNLGHRLSMIFQYDETGSAPQKTKRRPGDAFFLRDAESELHQFFFFLCQRRINLLDGSVGHFLNVVL